MNRNVVIAGVLGAVGGFLLGYFIAKKETEKLVDEAYSDASREYEAQLADYVEEKYGASSDEFSEVVKRENLRFDHVESMDEDDIYEDDCGAPDDTGEAYLDDNVTIAGDPDWNAKEAALPDEYEEYVLDRIGPGNDDEVKRPYIITLDDFVEGEPGYAKFTCMFLSGDSTLINEDEVVQEIHHTIGGMFMVEYMNWAHENQNRSVFYIRNDNMAEDYEVLWTNRSYGRDYLSIDFDGDEKVNA